MLHFDFDPLRRAVGSAKPCTRSGGRTALAMLALTAVTVAGCGQEPSKRAGGQAAERIASMTPAAAATVTSDRYETALERRGGRLRIDPVPPSYESKISKADAFGVFKAQGVFPETATREPADVRLGLYTSDRLKMTLPAVYLGQPTWVIRYDNVPAEAPAGPLGTGGAAQAMTAGDGPVNLLVFIDADTGRYLDAVRDPVSLR